MKSMGAGRGVLVGWDEKLGMNGRTDGMGWDGWGLWDLKRSWARVGDT
jgi:hypothetical protein